MTRNRTALPSTAERLLEELNGLTNMVGLLVLVGPDTEDPKEMKVTLYACHIHPTIQCTNIHINVKCLTRQYQGQSCLSQHYIWQRTPGALGQVGKRSSL